MPVLTINERETQLADAADKYMRDEISEADFEEAERRYMTDYSLSLQALAHYLNRQRTSPFQKLLALLAGVLLPLHHN